MAPHVTAFARRSGGDARASGMGTGRLRPVIGQHRCSRWRNDDWHGGPATTRREGPSPRRGPRSADRRRQDTRSDDGRWCVRSCRAPYDARRTVVRTTRAGSHAHVPAGSPGLADDAACSHSVFPSLTATTSLPIPRRRVGVAMCYVKPVRRSLIGVRGPRPSPCAGVGSVFAVIQHCDRRSSPPPDTPRIPMQCNA